MSQKNQLAYPPTLEGLGAVTESLVVHLMGLVKRMTGLSEREEGILSQRTTHRLELFKRFAMKAIEGASDGNITQTIALGVNIERAMEHELEEFFQTELEFFQQAVTTLKKRESETYTAHRQDIDRVMNAFSSAVDGDVPIDDLVKSYMDVHAVVKVLIARVEAEGRERAKREAAARQEERENAQRNRIRQLIEA